MTWGSRARLLFGSGLALIGGLATLTGCSLEPLTCDGCPQDGLAAPVSLHRDGLGIVHIYGATDWDVVYGAGYAQARDRLFEMDLTRRQALGRRAEILGEGAAGEDELIRIIGIPRWGAASAAQMQAEEPEHYALLEAWTAGVNAFIEEVELGSVPLPYGFGPEELDYMPERWAESDGLSVGKLILFGNASQIEFEILASILFRYFGDVTAKLPVITPLVDAFILPPAERPQAGAKELSHHEGPPAERLPLPADAAERLRAFQKRMAPFRPGASNNWALEGRFTETGQPMIAGDPHQGLRSPSLMWAHHMNSYDAGGNLDVAGFAFVGTPGVQLGHNRSIAWTATTAYPDVMDLLDVPYDEDSVTIAGEPIAIEASEETIQVRDGQPRVVTIEEVPGYGVLLPDGLSPLPIVDLGHRLLLRWPGRKATREGSSFLELDLATGLDDFDAAVAKNEIGNFNFLAISAEGLTYRSLPETPLHVNVRDDAPPYRVIDASDPANLWQTMVAQELLPQSRAATRGWLASANNDPFGFTADNSLEGDAFYYGIFFDPGTRAGRIEQELTRLTAEGPVSKADMMALQTDTYSLLADALLPVLLEAHAAVPNDDALAAFRDRPDLDALVTLLDDWDRRMERDSAAALVHHALLWFVTKNVLRDDLGPVFDAVSDQSPIYTLKWALLTVTRAYAAADELMQEGRDLLVMQALDETAAFLVERFGTTDPSAYAWRDFHATRFGSLWGDALASEPVATDGADGTVNVSAAAFLRDGEPVERHLSGSGAIYRFVATLDGDGVPRAELHFPRGNSGEPTSPYFSNNLEDWVEDRYRPLLFRTEEVMAGSEEMVELSP